MATAFVAMIHPSRPDFGLIDTVNTWPRKAVAMAHKT